MKILHRWPLHVTTTYVLHNITGVFNDNIDYFHSRKVTIMYNNSNITVENVATELDNTSNWKSLQNCVPVMIAHLNRYSEDLKIWGMPATIVTFLAIVDEIDIVSTKVNFKFHDETGSLNGVKWLNSEIYECPIKINSYAKVYGTMRKQHNGHYVLVTIIQSMAHLNELCAHLMEVTFVCLEAENLANQAAQNRSTNNTSTEHHNSSVSAAPSIDNGAHSDLSYEQNLVMNIIARGHPEDGQERYAIKCQVPVYLAPQVDAILEFLSSEGHIYTTKTDDHFKTI